MSPDCELLVERKKPRNLVRLFPLKARLGK
jgi:hypothetical protein